MNEMNTNPQHTAETSALYLEELNRVEEERNTARAMNLVLQEDVTKKANILSALTELVQEEFNKGGWDEDDEFFQGLCRYLDIETTEEIEVLVKAEWVVTLTHKKGHEINLGDICVDVDDPTIDLYDSAVSVENIGYVETSVDEL
jgi:hypothetical protein